MSSKVTCTCGWSWNKSDSSKKDMYVCHQCGKDNTMKNGGWLSKFDVPEAENGIEGTMGGLTDQGFNYNGAWGGTMAMGGSLPGSVGFTYARTQDPAPSKGKYAKKTMASAQNGQEMKFYQEGLDWKPKTISRDGGWLSKYEDGGIIEDDLGQWEHPGEITKINSNQITMQGVDYPVLGISDTGDTQMMQPGQDYSYEGESVTEIPMAQTGRSVKPLYVSDPNDPRLKAHDDSLNLYNSYKNIKEITTKKGYKSHYPPDAKWIDRLNKDLKNPVPSTEAGRNNKDGSYSVREINPSTGQYFANTTIPMQLYNPSIKPIGMQILESTSENDSWDRKGRESIPKHIKISEGKIKKDLKDKSEEGFFTSLLSSNNTDALPFWDYSNVNPKQPVVYQKPVIKKLTTKPVTKKPTTKPISKKSVQQIEEPKPNNSSKIISKAETKKDVKPDNTMVQLMPFGLVPKYKVDSLNNIGYKRAIGNSYINSGGMETYGPDSSDAIKKGLNLPSTKGKQKNGGWLSKYN